MMDPAHVRPLLPPPADVTARHASAAARADDSDGSDGSDGYSGVFRLDPAEELQSRRRLLGFGVGDGDDGGGDPADPLSQLSGDDMDGLLDDHLDDILSDQDSDDGTEARGRGGGGAPRHRLRVATGVMQLEGGMAPDEWGAIDPVTGAPRLLCGDRVTAPDSERTFKFKSPADGKTYPLMVPINRFYGSKVYPPTGPPAYPGSLSVPGYTAAQRGNAICAESSACDDECAYKLCNEGGAHTRNTHTRNTYKNTQHDTHIHARAYTRPTRQARQP
jgi:hypothetical protein